MKRMEHDGEHQIKTEKWSKIYSNRLHLKI